MPIRLATRLGRDRKPDRRGERSNREEVDCYQGCFRQSAYPERCAKLIEGKANDHLCADEVDKAHLAGNVQLPQNLAGGGIDGIGQKTGKRDWTHQRAKRRTMTCFAKASR